ncbi:ABC transporter substrate-binding protein [Bradyrhizobium erythrophlei]|uniref:Putative ABC transport system substrate-binding protein n=1 Tax=Bradyrhizobium erythrophlei TaxID=1437360 RepID=A0A1M7U4Y8_9BRAD|nr:ABC transporter substrate-binding protein [Bradyrhizobium erythrophlei]SHN77995.1 putative ABC transport system substrate-binding protein [Bradyrhizobium erythrophlei]
MKRREFITLISGAATAWPFAAYAEQSTRIRKVAVILGVADDTEGHARLGALKQGMETLGWFEGRNAHFDVRYTAANPEIIRSATSEIMGRAPDVIVANTNKVVIALKQQTRALPIVFVQVIDPVTAGLVESLSAPGGNVTGFMSADFSLSAKSVETLKEIAPQVTRLAMLRDSTDPQSIGQAASVQMAATSLGMELTSIEIGDADTISRGIDLFARRQNGGLVVTATPLSTVHLETIIAAAARNKLPAIYPYRYFANRGGLISYGADNLDLWRRAATYVDRILKGANPSELPVQQPTKFALIINLKTAKALDLKPEPTLLARADEVIE